jgi:hypothetical protein
MNEEDQVRMYRSGSFELLYDGPDEKQIEKSKTGYRWSDEVI